MPNATRSGGGVYAAGRDGEDVLTDGLSQ